MCGRFSRAFEPIAVIRSFVLMRLPNVFLQKIKTYLETKIA